MLAAALWVIASLALGFLLSWLSRRLLGRLTSRTANIWDDQLVSRLGGPLTIGWAATYIGLSWLDLAPAADDTARRLLEGIFLRQTFPDLSTPRVPFAVASEPARW